MIDVTCGDKEDLIGPKYLFVKFFVKSEHSWI